MFLYLRVFRLFIVLIFFAIIFSVFNNQKLEPSYESLGLTNSLISGGGKIIVDFKSVGFKQLYDIEKDGIKDSVGNYNEIKRYYKEKGLNSEYEKYVGSVSFVDNLFDSVYYVLIGFSLISVLSGLFGKDHLVIGSLFISFSLFLLYNIFLNRGDVAMLFM